jgi:large subunit ribosomal protein L24
MATPARVTGRTKVPEIRRGDTVVVLTGRDAGKRGVVDRIVRRDPAPSSLRSGYRRTSPKGGIFVVVDGINVAKRHTKAQARQGQSDRMPRMQQGGILDIAKPMPIGKVMLVCNKCEKPTRVAHQTLDNGQRVRACRHCGEHLEVTTK